MIKKNFKYIIMFVVGVLVIVGVVLLSWYFDFLGGEKKLYRQISDKPDLIQVFNNAIEGEKEIKKNPTKEMLYLQVGLDWKTIGELSGKEDFFRKSLSVYERGIEKFGDKNVLFYSNGGKLAERVGEYGKAEKYFKAVIEISPGDESGYINLVDLYRYKMNKSETEILSVFEQGLKKMMSNTPLISARATYLRWAGDYKAALEDYKILVEKFPNHNGYKQIVAELEENLKK